MSCGSTKSINLITKYSPVIIRKYATMDDSFSDSGDEYDREISRLEEEIRREKLQMVQKEELAKRQLLQLKFQIESQKRREKSVLAELNDAERAIENAQIVTGRNLRTFAQTATVRLQEKIEPGSSTTETIPKPKEGRSQCVVM